jgi:NADH:ubiquinone oxidoreductase subunit 5 (subunit L)/multisubunit Na+/H+ antiporter MnhA subunit
MLVATVLSLAYSLRFVSKVFLGQSKSEKKIVDVPNFMKLAMGILAVLVIVFGIWPTFFVNLITTVSFV